MSSGRRAVSSDRVATLPLFPGLPESTGKRSLYKRLREPVWTENKARFIERYLYFFVQITKHGAYVDGFAGPQWPDKPDRWAARLVLESEPRWLRHFYLCEINRNKLRLLRSLVTSQPAKDGRGRRIQREIRLCPGDFNKTVDGILKEISKTEATFCLLDQHTFECDWATVVKLASHKKGQGNKIELFYFLAVGWIHRAFSGLKGTEKAIRWWGRNDWQTLRGMTHEKIATAFRERFENELGYRYVAMYPIFERRDSQHIMYYMIYSSDHDEAPKLMVRAYNRAVRPLKIANQPDLPFPARQS